MMEVIDYCPICYKVHGQAYNGVFQLRNPSQEIIDFIDKEILKYHDKNAFCIKIIEVKNGIDYHFSSGAFTKRLGHSLRQRFGGQLIETSRLVTRSKETSKDLYRVTVLFRVPDFKKGDIVNFKGHESIVLNLGNRVYIRDTKTNRKQQAKYEDISK